MAIVSLPRLLYTGQLYRISVDATDPGYEYRTIYTGPTGGWQLPAFTATGTYQVDTSTSYWAAIGLQSRQIGSTALASNTYEGQIPVVDLAKADGLLHQSFDGRLQVRQFDSDISLEAADTAWRAGITSWQDLSQFVETKFQAASGSLPFAGDEARAFYYMQWVSGLWQYGNLNNPTAQGCVINNEVTGPIDPLSVTVRTFLDSPIGCCTDYTTVLSFLLMNAGIETRVITGLGHVFLEAKLDGAWWSVDANLNIAMRAPFDEVLDTSRTIDIYRFDHAGMREGSPIYHDILVDFYHYHMQMLEFGHFEGGARRDALTFYNTLAWGHTFTDALASTGWTGGGQDFATGQSAARGYTLGDFNGDGRDDVMEAVSGTLGAKIRLSSGGGLDAATTWSANAAPSTATGTWLVGDFNGDGRDDLLSDQGGTTSAQVFISTGTAFSAPASWTAVTSGDWQWWAGDFNGDGRTDVMRMVVGVSGAEVHLSNGTSFVSAGSWTGAGSGSHRWYVGDFNGDGRDDLAGYQTGVGTLVHLSSGLSFNANTYWSTADTGGGTAFFVGDFNGDGRDDLGRRMSDGTFETMQSTGSSFSAPALLATRNLLPTYDLQVGDFDGDLSADVFFAQRVSNGGAVQALSNTPSYNGFTVSEMGRIVPFTASRFHLSEVDSPIGAQAAAVDLTSITSLQALYTMAVTAFALQSSGPHFDAFSAPVDRVMFFAQWIGNLSLDTAAANLDQAASDQRNKATLLAAFLEREGIASFVVTAGQATVNEVFVDGGWWSINAALGVALRGRWHDVIDTAVQPRGYVFDTAAMTAGAATYSPFVAQLHENFLLSSGTGVGFTFDRALAIDWIAAQAGGASVAGFVALPLETKADTAWSAPLHAGRKWFTGDFDGDGRTDLMSSAGSAGATIALSSGTSFANGVAWTAATSGNQGWYVGDFNGDHRTDIFAVVSGVSGAQMLLSTGSGFTSGGGCFGRAGHAVRRHEVSRTGVMDGCRTGLDRPVVHR